MGVEQGEFNVDIDLLLVNQFISLIRVAALVDPTMSDETIKSACEAVLRLGNVHSECKQPSHRGLQVASGGLRWKRH